MSGFNEFQGYERNEGHIFQTLQAFFCKNYLINSIISSIFGRLFLHFKKQVNKGKILNFYEQFIYKNSVINFKIFDLWVSQDEFTI